VSRPLGAILPGGRRACRCGADGFESGTKGRVRLIENASAPDDPVTRLRILVVDDEQANVSLLERVLRRAGYPHVEGTTDASSVAEVCERFEPQLLLLDLHMPGLDGFEVMARLSSSIAARDLTVVVLTADVTTQSRRRALSLGARDFLVKPFDPVEVLARVRNLLENHHQRRQLLDHNELLQAQVRARTRELECARREVLDRLALAAEYRDYSTGEHTKRVGRTARMLAKTLGLDDRTAEIVGDAAPLHDIGKLAIPDVILLKRGPLTPEEMQVMRTHVRVGVGILRGSQSPVLRTALELVTYHHERWDGSGYDRALAGPDIPLSGRITALADVFDAITHDRPYKTASAIADAVAYIRAGAGRHFDPTLVEAFMELDHHALV
jgi:putative two-component system response regulator